MYTILLIKGKRGILKSACQYLFTKQSKQWRQWINLTYEYINIQHIILMRRNDHPF